MALNNPHKRTLTLSVGNNSIDRNRNVIRIKTELLIKQKLAQFKNRFNAKNNG